MCPKNKKINVRNPRIRPSLPRISLTGVYIASYLVIPTQVVRRSLYTRCYVYQFVCDVYYRIYSCVFYLNFKFIFYFSCNVHIGTLFIQCQSLNRKTINTYNIFPVSHTNILCIFYIPQHLSYYFLTAVSYNIYFTSRWRLSNRFLDYKIQLYTLLYCILFQLII